MKLYKPLARALNGILLRSWYFCGFELDRPEARMNHFLDEFFWIFGHPGLGLAVQTPASWFALSSCFRALLVFALDLCD